MGSARYTAFLSYSHKDAAHARWLHRRLETYRVPKRLVGSEGEHGPVPARLAPIFRDREELPAASDLSEKVRAALAASDNLIVLCSPGSAASPWVAKEIAAFRDLRPGRPILAAIVEGEPGQCFPASLSADGAEPLAADLRPGRDGRRLGFLKLVAGLAGVGLDTLLQRDAQRRIRSVTWITAGAMAVALVMTVMMVVAINARAEAEDQRAEAESLVEFMLTDLRDRLRRVGRLDVMNAVNVRALHYYRSRPDRPELTVEARARQARIFHALGEDKLDRDDFDGALAAFRKAGETTRQQLELFPADTQRLLDHAKSENGLGRVYELRRDWKSAERHFSRYARTADSIGASALGESAAAAINLGNVAAGRKDYLSAEKDYRKAIRLLEVAVSLRKDDTHLLLTLANAQAWLADTFYRRGQWQSSLKGRQRQHEIMTTLRTQEPKSAEADFRYAAADRGLACSLWKSGDRRGAARYFLSAYKRVTGLASGDPHNARWRLLRQKLSDDLLRGGVPLARGITPAGLKADLDGDAAQGCTGADGTAKSGR